MPTIQVKRANLATTIQATGLKDGEFAYAKDTNKLYIGTMVHLKAMLLSILMVVQLVKQLSYL